MSTTSRTVLALLTAGAVLMLPAAAAGKRENAPGIQHAPGIQKKIPLTLSNICVQVAGTLVTISWETNKPADSSISITEVPLPPGGDPLLLIDTTLTTDHTMTVPVGVGTFEYEIISADEYGFVARAGGIITIP